MRATDRPGRRRGRIHTFCHAAPERWYQLGATLSAGLSLRWLRDRLRLDVGQPVRQPRPTRSGGAAGADGLIFLPYLVGERSPIMDPAATGAFVGLTLRHRRAHLARAVLEGVACSLRATRDAVLDAGGGLRSLAGHGQRTGQPALAQHRGGRLRRAARATSTHPSERASAPPSSAASGRGLFAGYERQRGGAPAPAGQADPGPRARGALRGGVCPIPAVSALLLAR